MSWTYLLIEAKYQNSPKEETGNICIKEIESTGENLKNKQTSRYSSLSVCSLVPVGLRQTFLASLPLLS